MLKTSTTTSSLLPCVLSATENNEQTHENIAAVEEIGSCDVLMLDALGAARRGWVRRHSVVEVFFLC